MQTAGMGMRGGRSSGSGRPYDYDRGFNQGNVGCSIFFFLNHWVCKTAITSFGFSSYFKVDGADMEMVLTTATEAMAVSAAY